MPLAGTAASSDKDIRNDAALYSFPGEAALTGVKRQHNLL